MPPFPGLILPRKVLFAVLLLLSSQFSSTSGFAQRKIEWFEPDFDSAYCRHMALYTGTDFGEIFPYHISAFHSKTFGKIIRSVSKKVLFDRRAELEVLKFDNHGWLIEQYINGKKYKYSYAKDHRIITKKLLNDKQALIWQYYYSENYHIDSVQFRSDTTIGATVLYYYKLDPLLYAPTDMLDAIYTVTRTHRFLERKFRYAYYKASVLKEIIDSVGKQLDIQIPKELDALVVSATNWYDIENHRSDILSHGNAILTFGDMFIHFFNDQGPDFHPFLKTIKEYDTEPITSSTVVTVYNRSDSGIAGYYFYDYLYSSIGSKVIFNYSLKQEKKLWKVIDSIHDTAYYQDYSFLTEHLQISSRKYIYSYKH